MESRQGFFAKGGSEGSASCPLSNRAKLHIFQQRALRIPNMKGAFGSIHGKQEKSDEETPCQVRGYADKNAVIEGRSVSYS